MSIHFRKKTLHQAKIHSLSHEGRGISHLDGKVHFIDNALPDETVNFVYQRKRGKHAEGQALEIIEQSSFRAIPPCKHYDLCGGCRLQHLQVDQQISHKEKVMLEQLAHFAKVTPDEVLPPLTSKDQGYRHKARLAVKYVQAKQRVVVGFREQHSRFVADIEHCPVLHSSIDRLILPLQVLISQLSIREQIPQIEVAVGEDKAALIFRHLQALSEADQNQLIDFAKQHKIDIYCQPKGMDSIHRLWPTEGIERLQYTLPNFNLTYQFYPTDFTQVNPIINQQMVTRACELLALNEEDSVLDLFCGLGNFSLAMACKAKQVTGIEGSEAMVERAYENAKLNQINNVDFHACDLTQEVSTQPWTQQTYTKILLDPPRSGAQELIPAIAQLRPARIVYVSCQAASMARDIGLLAQQGYHLATVGVMDMFPHTQHVESIALLTREK